MLPPTFTRTIVCSGFVGPSDPHPRQAFGTSHRRMTGRDLGVHGTQAPCDPEPPCPDPHTVFHLEWVKMTPAWCRTSGIGRPPCLPAAAMFHISLCAGRSNGGPWVPSHETWSPRARNSYLCHPAWMKMSPARCHMMGGTGGPELARRGLEQRLPSSHTTCVPTRRCPTSGLPGDAALSRRFFRSCSAAGPS